MSLLMKIPVANIYYLLCYAWNKLEERDLVEIDPASSSKLLDLFARVLISGMNHLLKRGFDRGYVNYQEDSRRVRGKIDLGHTLRRSLLTAGRVHCEYGELSYDVLHNRLLKSTLTRLIKATDLDNELREALVHYRSRLHEVHEIELTRNLFSRVQLHRNNSIYDFLMRICEIIFDNLLPTETTGKWKFRDFLQDEVQMAGVFESFIRNFYKLEATKYKVGREDIQWRFSALDEGSANLLPKMQTDISLVSPGKKMIVECKYTANLFQEHYGTLKFQSAHLYQVSAYLSNLPDNPLNDTCCAILLYPTVDQAVRSDFKAAKCQTVSVRTLNLNQDWHGIHRDLLSLVA
jgi:5-methylcytosine-specific restriction enzyme subunit McrC